MTAQNCYCESSLCDHNDVACKRPADPSLRMEYVEHTCRECAENMRATGGAEYVFDVSTDYQLLREYNHLVSLIGKRKFRPRGEDATLDSLRDELRAVVCELHEREYEVQR